LISIIIPAWNQYEMTRECITAIRETTQDCEIVLVDNGSDPPFTKPYTGFIDFTIIRNEENLGFPVAVNQGIRASKGDTIVLLNNDVIVTEGWSEKLLAALQKYSIVGPMTSDCAGTQRAQIGVYEDKESLNKAAGEWAEHYGGHIQEVRWVIGFCMAFPKSLVEEIGYFDESLWPCCGEEIDFCLRAGGAGHRIGIVYDCYVHHEMSVTFKAMEPEISYRDIIFRNEKHLEKKWGKDWIQQSVSDSPTPEGVCINLGCGHQHLDEFINIDNRPETKPDLLCDVFDGLPFEDGSVDMVRADDFLEHIPSGKVYQVIEEIWRVLKRGGVFESLTPDAEYGQGAFQDPHHVSFWVENTWRYFSDDAMRGLYGMKANFAIESIERRETGDRAFHLHVIARAKK
jgi:GT2 family glycosyltransferase